MSKVSPVLVWFRRDFRLHDNPMLRAAQDSGRPIIPIFILDEIAKIMLPNKATNMYLINLVCFKFPVNSIILI